MNAANKSILYRPEIDGLRALAVIPVILFHAGFTSLSGGFIGVDIFFVISGYLITAILIKELDIGKFSLLEFYKRRARRILPALFFVISCCLPLAWMLLTPDDLKRFGLSLFSVSTFISNFYFWRNTDYFDPAAEDQLLLHTWSLSVEEQYYLFFPIMLFFIFPFGKLKTFIIIAVMTLISFQLCIWSLHNFPDANFYLLPTRAWELFCGSIVAIIYFWQPQKFNNMPLFLKNLCSFSGLLMIVGSILFMDKSTPFPGTFTLFPIFGSVLIIAFARDDTLVGKILSLKIIVFVGLISYSAYLWHQPIFVFSRILSVNPLQPIDYMIPIIMTIGLSIFSLNYIERPFRTIKYSSHTILGTSLVALITMGAIGLSGYFANGFEGRLEPTVAAELRKYSHYQKEKAVGDCVLLSSKNPNETFSPDCFGPQDDTPIIYLIGDSHAAALAPALAKKIPASYGLAQLTMSGCYPVLGVQADAPIRCKDLSDSRFSSIKENKHSIVLLHANWQTEQLIGKESNLQHNLKNTIDYILKKIKPENVVIIGCVPTWSPTLPKYLLQKGLLGAESLPEYLYNSNFKNRNICNAELETIAINKKIKFSNPMDALCKKNMCITHVKDKGSKEYMLTTRDETHLTKAGSDIFISELLGVILD